MTMYKTNPRFTLKPWHGKQDPQCVPYPLFRRVLFWKQHNVIMVVKVQQYYVTIIGTITTPLSGLGYSLYSWTQGYVFPSNDLKKRRSRESYSPWAESLTPFRAITLSKEATKSGNRSQVQGVKVQRFRIAFILLVKLVVPSKIHLSVFFSSHNFIFRWSRFQVAGYRMFVYSCKVVIHLHLASRILHLVAMLRLDIYTNFRVLTPKKHTLKICCNGGH